MAPKVSCHVILKIIDSSIVIGDGSKKVRRDAVHLKQASDISKRLFAVKCLDFIDIIDLIDLIDLLLG